MKKELILSIDAGTTSIRAVVYDKKLKQISSSQKEFRQIYPKNGFVEHDPDEIYNTVLSVIKRAVNILDVKDIKGIGITNQRETAVVWNKEAKHVYNAIVWQCRRSSGICKRLKDQNLQDLFLKKTGLIIDPYFSGTKLTWLFENRPDIFQLAENNDLLFGTLDSYLIYRLTDHRSHVTDYTNASRTLLYNIKDKEWDEELCKILNVPKTILPKVNPSASVFGYTKNAGILPDNIPIVSVVGDQQASLAGNLCFEKGSAKITYGTGSFMLLNTGDVHTLSSKGLLTTLASGFDGSPLYALEGSVFITGAVIQWIRDELKLIENAKESEILAKQAKMSTSLFLVPGFVGLGCPYWEPNVSGTIVGLRRDTNYKDIVKAALDSIALQINDVYEVFKEIKEVKINKIKIDGGASKNNYLMQFQSNMLNKPLYIAKDKESTALGAAVLAGSKLGFFDFNELQTIIKTDKEFFPEININKRKKTIMNWKKAVKSTISYKPE